MFRHLHTSINYELLIKMQANQQTFAPAVSRKAELKKSSNKVKKMTKTNQKHK